MQNRVLVLDKNRQQLLGTHVGRVAIRARPSFALSTAAFEKPFDVHPKYLTILHRNDGYVYKQR